ncbi:MAG: hypothetical protein IT310_02975 [Anaerolineales bacterium]|nr:hypothetical protein [Anaerolineales bacterium]
MSFSQALDVAVGLIFIYYVLGSMVSLVTGWINEMLETRGVALEKYLIKIAGEHRDNKYLNDLIALPQLQALQPIRYKNLWSVFTAETKPKKIEKIPVGVLVDAYFDIAGLTANPSLPLIQLAELIDKLPDSEAKRAFMSWINQGVTNVNDLRARTTAYFTGLMEQAAAKFRANARSFVIMLSLAITVLFGTDSIQLARALWSSAELRAIAVAKADMVIKEEGVNVNLPDLIKELSDLSIKIGWWQTDHPAAGALPMEWVGYVLLKILGLGLTVVAVSQGASFWYDLLKKIVTPTKSLKLDEPKG